MAVSRGTWALIVGLGAVGGAGALMVGAMMSLSVQSEAPQIPVPLDEEATAAAPEPDPMEPDAAAAPRPLSSGPQADPSASCRERLQGPGFCALDLDRLERVGVGPDRIRTLSARACERDAFELARLDELCGELTAHADDPVVRVGTTNALTERAEDLGAARAWVAEPTASTVEALAELLGADTSETDTPPRQRLQRSWSFR